MRSALPKYLFFWLLINFLTFVEKSFIFDSRIKNSAPFSSFSLLHFDCVSNEFININNIPDS